MQRRIERAIRKQKNRILVDEAAGDKDKLLSDQIRLQRYRQEYVRFSKAAGLRTQNERAQVAGFGRKQAAEAIEADKKNQIVLENQIRYDTMVKYLKDNKLVPQNATVHIPPRSVNATGFSFDSVHINAERGHNVTKEQAVQWVEGARISLTVWKGRFEKYYGNEGATFLDVEKSEIRTAFSSRQFDDTVKSILEVLTKNGY